MTLLNELISDGRNKKKMTSFPVVMVHYSKLVPSEANYYMAGERKRKGD